MNHRNDVQILRGVAVTLVVLFHLGFSQLRLGFLGVDVFFVISGFLMAILCGQGSVRQFFERRARRLLPAYFVTVILVVIASALITLPVENRQVLESSVWATFFASNIGFWLQNSYFSKSEFTPLLHLWSLGVEIQFYLIVPLLYILGRRFKLFLPLLLIVSLAFCIVVTNISPKTAFFMMPFRVWQFLIGWLIAWHITDAGSVIKRSWNAPAGAIAIVSLLLVPLLPLEPAKPGFLLGHPGMASLFVCVATGVVLACGLPRVLEANLIGRALETIGNYSYSIYLVHYPVIVLALYQPFSGTVLGAKNAGGLLFQLALITTLSLFMYSFVEKRGNILFSSWKIAGAMAAVIVMSVTLGPLNSLSFTEDENKIFDAWTDRSAYRCGKVARILNPSASFCDITPISLAEDAPSIFLVGNSHADSIKQSFATAAASSGYRTYFAVPNNPLMVRSNNHEWLIESMRGKNASAVALHFSPSAALPMWLGDLPTKLTAENIKTMFFLPVPTYEVHVPSALYLHHTQNGPLPVMKISGYSEANKDILAYAETQVGNGLSYYDTGAVLCNPNCLLITGDGRPAYFDGGHLTLTGAELLEGLFKGAVASIGN